MPLAVIQARTGSSRLPGKVLLPLGDKPVLAWIVDAARAAGCFDDVVVATTHEAADAAVARWCEANGVSCVRGPVDDVLARFLQVVDAHPSDSVTRLTADCPLLDPAIIRAAVAVQAATASDYVSTALQRTLPRGLDVEVTTPAVLRQLDAVAEGHHRTHVTSYIYTYSAGFDIAGLMFAPVADDLRVTLDTAEDFELLQEVRSSLALRAPPSFRAVIDLLRKRADLRSINAHVTQKRLVDG